MEELVELKYSIDSTNLYWLYTMYFMKIGIKKTKTILGNFLYTKMHFLCAAKNVRRGLMGQYPIAVGDYFFFLSV